MLKGLKSATWLKGQVKLSGRGVSSFRTAAERSVQHGNFTEAAQHLGKAIEEADSYGLMAPRVVLRIDLADVQRVSARRVGGSPDRSQLAVAQTTARSAVDLAAEASDAPLYVLGLDALAEVLIDLEDFPALVPVAEGAVRVSEPLPDPDPALMAQRTMRVALAWTRTGRVEDAAGIVVKAIELQIRAHGEESPETGTLLVDAAKIYRIQGNASAAEEILRTAIKIHKKSFGELSVELLRDYIELSQVLLAAHDVHGAVTNYERALAMQQTLMDRGNEELRGVDVAEMLYDLAQLQIRCGNVGRAQELIRDCITTIQKSGSGESGAPRMAQCHEALAGIEESCGRMDTAVDELQRAASAWERAGVEHVHDLVEILEFCATLQQKLLRNRDAAHSRDRAARALEALAEMQNESPASESETPQSSGTMIAR